MIDRPPLSARAILTSIRDSYDFDVSGVSFLPTGNENSTWIFLSTVVSPGCEAGPRADRYIVKLKRGRFALGSLHAARRLRDRGEEAVIAPIPNRAGGLSAHVDGTYTLALFPYVDGASAMEVGLSHQQRLALGRIVRRIHDSLPTLVDTGAIDVAGLTAECYRPNPQWIETIESVEGSDPRDDVDESLLAIWWEHCEEIALVLRRYRELCEHLAPGEGDNAASRTDTADSRRMVPCHGDIHAGNVIVSPDGGLHIVDWDGAILAPRERDLMFHGDDPAFREGYGPYEIDRRILSYYRHEWVVQEFADYAWRVLVCPYCADATRRDAVRELAQLFAPGDVVEAALEQ